MKTKIYKNQEKAANEIYERLEVHNDGAVILHSMPQVGKTGTVIDVCQQLAKKNPDYAVLYFGPSDKQLHAQSKVRFKEYPLAFFTLLGNDVYHDGEIYPGTRGTKYKQIVEFIQMANEVGKKFLVVRDEAHIGIGTQDKGLQKIPQFFEDILGGLPGINTSDRVQYLLVTATPFTYDYQTAISKAKITEIYLEPGEGYLGPKELAEMGRILPNVLRLRAPNWKSKSEKRKWEHEQNTALVLRLAELIKEQFNSYNNKGYFVFRCTRPRDLPFFERAFTMSGIPYEIYESRTNSIPDFERQLGQPPTGPMINLIKHSYKQGKTLCLQHVVGWYENDTSNGRHHADIAQSAGRCFGYEAHKYSFPIYCDIAVIDELIEYYDHCGRRDLTSKRDMPMSSTHTTYKSKIINERDYQICVNKEAAMQAYKNKNPDYKGKFNTTKVSTNNAQDVIQQIHNKAYRQKTADRVNIFFIDGANANYKESFMSVPHWWGMWIVLFDTGSTITVHEAKDKSFYSIREPEGEEHASAI